MRHGRWILLPLLLILPVLAYGWTGILTWSPNTESDLAGYKLYHQDGPCPASAALPGPARDLGKVTTYTDTVPDTLSTRCWALTAYDLVGNESAQSATVSKTVAVALPPAKVTSLSFAGPSKTFSWVQPSDPTIAKTWLYVHQSSLAYDWTLPGNFRLDVSGLVTQTVSGMLWSTTYDCWIVNVNSAGAESEAAGTACSTPAAPAPTAPVLVVSATALTFSAQQHGPAPAAQTVAVSNSTAGTSMPWTVLSSQPWLTVSPVGGTNSGTITVTVAHGALAPGTHTGTVTVSAPSATGSPKTIAVTLTVAPDTTPPTPPKGLFVASTTVAPDGTVVAMTIHANRADCPGGVGTVTLNTSTRYGRRIECRPVSR